jgi:hypothetical protein
MIKKTINFLKEVGETAYKTVKDFTVRLFKNSPAITVMIFASFGVTTMLAQLPIEAFFVPIVFISEAMVVPVLAIGIVFGLAFLAGKLNDVQELQPRAV